MKLSFNGRVYEVSRAILEHRSVIMIHNDAGKFLVGLPVKTTRPATWMALGVSAGDLKRAKKELAKMAEEQTKCV